MNLKQKIIEIRKEVDYLQKDAKGYNYSYVKEENILAAIKGKMNELNVLLEPHIRNHGLSDFNYITKAGVSVTESIVSGDLVFIWSDADSEETREIDWAIYGQNRDASQALGSGLTYCTRYFLLKYFNVATSKDDPDAWRQAQNKKEDEDYAKSIKRIKTNLADKLLLEANNDKELSREALQKTMKELEFKNWEDVDLEIVSENVFIAKYKVWLEMCKKGIE
jgi:hypothetical protein